MEDGYKHKGRRKRLVEDLRQKGISNPAVLAALMDVPRHFFFPTDFEDEAYEDKAFPIESGQTISQPFTVAFQTQLLDVKRGDKVLEVGTGSGYQGAILSAMGAELYTIERMDELFRKAVQRFKRFGYKAHCFLGDGSQGLPQHAPFDHIIVTAAATELAENLKHQLTEGGNLVIPVGDRHIQKMVLITRLVENKYQRSEHGEFKFVPLVGKHGWKS
ncbi:MAG: protein-L-isoaspartate(D-aspartate) O-methyltransferase [Flavobacteriales bacterium]|nr:protein-L-isoaspartate(D-aspartate) O-methyltransferase [Bacteroidota bacterium]MCB9242007.1 protein-L-isoaspartate(D-aspartate) O-methyltransferase [Flavobacteriales bacterium]